MYIYENVDTLDIKSELKNIADKLGYTYIERNPTVNTNSTHNGSIQVGQVTIKIMYRKYIDSILLSFNDNAIDCTDGIKDITNLSVDLQTASMIIKSIQESDIMD